MKGGVLFPFLFGQYVEVIRDTEIDEWGIQALVVMGSEGMVVQVNPGSPKTWVRFKDTKRYLPIPNMNLIRKNDDEQIQKAYQQ